MGKVEDATVRQRLTAASAVWATLRFVSVHIHTHPHLTHTAQALQAREVPALNAWLQHKSDIPLSASLTKAFAVAGPQPFADGQRPVAAGEEGRHRQR